MQRLKLFVAIVVATLVAAACGGDAGVTDTAPGPDTSTSQPAPDATNPAPTSPPDDGGDGGGDDSEGSGPSTATVTLGGETYTFSSEDAIVAQCLTDLFGIFSIQLPMVEGSGDVTEGFVTIAVLHEDTDPAEVGQVNSIEVAVGDEDWVANEDDDMFDSSDLLEPGMSQVDSVEIDGRTVRGTATFFRQNSLFGGSEVETMTGSFEATCGEERLS